MINTGFIWGVLGEVGVTGGDDSLLEPKEARTVGRKTSPWNTPYRTVRLKTLKKVMKTWEPEKGRMMTASSVVMPALTIAGPRVTKADWARSVGVPARELEPPPPPTLSHGEGMCNVDGVVNAETTSEDDVDADDHVDGHVPEVQRPNLQGGVLRYTN